MLAPGSLLAQVQTTAGPSLAYSAAYQTEITRIVVASVISTNDKFSLYHDDGGRNYSSINALFVNNIISSGQTIHPVISYFDGGGLSVKSGGTIGASSSSTGAITISIYGVTRPGR